MGHKDVSLHMLSVLSVRFEVGGSLLLASAGAAKRDPKAPFPLVENAGIQMYNWRFAGEYPPELRPEPGLAESTPLCVPTMPSNDSYQ